MWKGRDGPLRLFSSRWFQEGIILDHSPRIRDFPSVPFGWKVNILLSPCTAIMKCYPLNSLDTLSSWFWMLQVTSGITRNNRHDLFSMKQWDKQSVAWLTFPGPLLLHDTSPPASHQHFKSRRTVKGISNATLTRCKERRKIPMFKKFWPGKFEFGRALLCNSWTIFITD